MRLLQLVFVIAMAAACGGSKQAARSPGPGGAGSAGSAATDEAAPGGGSGVPDEASPNPVESDPCQGGE